MQLDVDIEPTFQICTYEIHIQTNGQTNAKITKAYTGELSAVIVSFLPKMSFWSNFFPESVVHIFRLLPYRPTIFWPSIILPPMIRLEILLFLIFCHRHDFLSQTYKKMAFCIFDHYYFFESVVHTFCLSPYKPPILWPSIVLLPMIRLEICFVI